MSIIKVDYGSVGGGIKHVECSTGMSGYTSSNLTVISNDGQFTLGDWSDYYSVTILKKCTVIERVNGQPQTTPRTVNVGDTISTISGGASKNVMLIEE